MFKMRRRIRQTQETRRLAASPAGAQSPPAAGAVAGEQKFAAATAMIEAMGDGLILVSMDGETLDVNNAFVRIFGYAREELLGTNIAALPTTKPEDIPRNLDFMREVIENGSAGPVEMNAVTKDGREIVCSFTASCLKDAQGNPNALFAVARDITALKHAEREQAKALEAAAAAQTATAVIAAMPDALFLLDMDGTIVSMNPAARSLLGDAEGMELVGAHSDELISRLVTSESRDTVLAALGTAIECQEVRFVDFVIQLADGRELPVASTTSFVRDTEGTPINMVAMVKDISDIRAAEEVLRKSEKRLQYVARATNDAIWDWDLTENTVWWGDAVEKLFGYSRDEIGSGVDWWADNIHREDRERVVSGLHASMDNGEPMWSDEYRFRRKDHSYAAILDRAFLIYDTSGKAIRAVGSMMDITERKRVLEEQAHLVQQLEAANRELREFAYVASHDLKAPLRGIATLAGWIASDYGETLGEEGKEQLGLLASRVDRMRNLIDGILHYSRVTHAEEKLTRIDLNQLLPELVDSIAPPANIEIAVAPGLPVIECGQTRITQVFQNLLSNAIRYMDKPRGLVRVECVEDEGFWKFIVADNGPGIAEQYHEKIFQIFQTLSRRDKGGGTGIGLAIVKKVVESYGGTVWLESEPDQGSTFFFTLPKRGRGKNARDSGPTPSIKDGRQRVVAAGA